jgi:hypothetical protein
VIFCDMELPDNLFQVPDLVSNYTFDEKVRLFIPDFDR